MTKCSRDVVSAHAAGRYDMTVTLSLTPAAQDMDKSGERDIDGCHRAGAVEWAKAAEELNLPHPMGDHRAAPAVRVFRVQ
jgi:hypothetical protein